jgi:excisionase family DNA binding protein
LDREAQDRTPRYTSLSQLMTVREVCAYLRVSRATMYRLLKEKQIPAFRLGSDWRFSIEQIDRWRLRQKPGE